MAGGHHVGSVGFSYCSSSTIGVRTFLFWFQHEGVKISTGAFYSIGERDELEGAWLLTYLS